MIPVFFSGAVSSAEVSLRYHYSRFHRVTELSAIGAFGVLAAGLAWRVAATLDGPAAWTIFGASIVTGYVLADLVSGIVHWLADRYGTEATPFLGSTFIRPFREHHLYPKAITEHDFIETNGSNCILSAPFMAVAFFSLPMESSLITTFLLSETLAFCLSILATNQFHKWAHMDTPPVMARGLSKLSLILSSEHHDIHHSAPFDRNYCITAGWWNPLLERLNVFARVEAGIALLTGLRPADVPTAFERDLKELI